MRKLFLIIVCIFIIQQIFSQKNHNIQPDSPAHIEFITKNHDFGKKLRNDTASYRFKFQNNGLKALNIKRVRTTCGCTSYSFSKTSIEPNEYGFIEIELDTDRPGDLYSEIKVVSDADNSPIYLSVTGYISLKK